MRSVRDEADFRQLRTAAKGFIFNDFARSGHPVTTSFTRQAAAGSLA